MRQVQAVLLSAVVVALCLVAWELHQIRTFLRPTDHMPILATEVASPVVETRAERNKRLQHEQQERMQDALAILSTPEPPKAVRPVREKPSIPASEQPPHR